MRTDIFFIRKVDDLNCFGCSGHSFVSYACKSMLNRKIKVDDACNCILFHGSWRYL